MLMRDNPVKQTLATGGISIGTMNLEFASTGVGRIMAEAGAEFCVFDMEHSGWSIETIKQVIATSRSANLVPFVRPPTTQYHLISRALDVGAMGLVIPLVNTPEQARFAVECAMYPPRGKRGCAFTLAHDDYTGGDLANKMQHANENVFIIAQIETEEGLRNVDAISATPGIDALWIGQFDLTASLGIPGQFDHPKYLDATKRIIEACHKHNKVATLAVTNPEELAAGPENGFRLLVYLADVWIYQKALRDGFRIVREKNGLKS
jgi:2-keto-3-deoxy-L-rhamnonate aldolase RhmA